MTTIDEFQLAAPIRALNQFGSILDRLHISLVDLTPETLISKTSGRTGLNDWGDADFLTDYKFLISCFERQQELTLLGRLGMRQEFSRVLTNHLQIQHLLKQRPEIFDAPINRPLFIVGLPRTGTTLLHKLMSQDAKMRVPPLWQLLAPFPLTDRRYAIDSRIKHAEQYVRLFNFAAPQARTIHAVSAHEPEECIFLLPHHVVYHLRAHIPEYKTWLLARDSRPDYCYYKQQLQSLAWQHPSQHWVMKSPSHLYSLDALLGVFPDACIVHTHRDLNRVLPSWCSFGAAMQKLHLKRSNHQAIGDEWLGLCKIGIERAMLVRQSANPAQFFDLHYADFIADPVRWLRQIYQHFNFELDEATESKMRSWLQDHSQEKHGTHHYAVEQFGLSEEQIREAFKDYVERFGVQPES